ncbi:flavin-containing monooxygenase [Nocardiopsis sp. NPDC050513]|uniref:flavin-containing monooxygenase n=1 Tax=Nocardiopsis sp. NPDC050513 TaxID=3364338 RepID=UPI0037BBFDD7
MEHVPLVIVGAGQAGLAAAHAANRRRVRPLVLEAADRPGGSWPHYYDSLTLFSPARFAALPGRPMPGDGNRYPSRDDVAAYLSDYASRLDADLRCGHRVTGVGTEDGAFTLTTADGSRVRTDAVVAATGSFGRPHRPDLPGLTEFGGAVPHSAEYRAPEAFAGQRVVVVGGGNSGVQIATELARVARVSLATRSPVAWVPQRPLGRDVHWWATRSGLDTAPLGHLWRGRATPVLDDGRHQSAFATGNPDQRAMFARLHATGVEWSDGTTEEVDTVLLATGYRPDLGFLHGTGALDGDGRPRHRAGVSTTVPGLGYVGLEFQRTFGSATLRGVGRDARHVLRRLLRGRGSR